MRNDVRNDISRHFPWKTEADAVSAVHLLIGFNNRFLVRFLPIAVT